jgi:uncharacterized protein DUF4339
MKKYYYLDGPEKKGPFEEDEFVNLNLDHDTLIWTEGLDNWKQLKDFPDLLKVIPPPLPDEVLPKPPKKKKSKKVGYSFLVLFVLLLVSFGIGYGIVESKKAKFKEDLSDRIDRIFQGKSIICDGVKYGVKGELKKVSRPIKNSNLEFDFAYTSAMNAYNKAKEEGIVERFTCSEGGFTFKKLQIIDLGYELEVTTSTNMVYTSNNYYRGSVQEGYNSAFEFMVEQNTGCYSTGYYELIENFIYLKNDYFYIENTEKPSSPYSSHWWSSSEGNIYNDNRKVYYKTEGWYYELSERDWRINEDYLIFSGIGGGISLLLFIILLSANPFKW